jgi:hypothetical protein
VFHEGHKVFRELAAEVTHTLLGAHPQPAVEIAINPETGEYTDTVDFRNEEIARGP